MTFCFLFIAATTALTGRPVLDNDVTLSGPSASAEVTFHHSGGERMLTVAYTPSPLIDGQRSVLSVLVDGTPVDAVMMTYSDDAAARRTVRFPNLTPGYHQLRISARLWLKHEKILDCPTRENDGRFVRILSRSRWQVSPPNDSAQVLGVGAAIEAWRTRNIEVRSTSLLDGFGNMPQDVADAVLAARQLIRSSGGQPLDDVTAPPHGALILRVATSKTTERSDGSRRKLLSLLRGDSYDAAAVVDNQQILFVGRTPAKLAAFARALAKKEYRERCPPKGPCLFRSGVVPADVPLKQPAEGHTAQIFSLADALGSAGWTTQGAGQHRLRFVAVRPSGMTLQGDAKLVLHFGAHAGQHVEAGVLTVRVNERPMATIPLRAHNQRHSVTLPDLAENDSAWVIDLDVWLDDHNARCTADGEAHTWFRLDSETEILGDHRTLRFGSISHHLDVADKNVSVRFSEAIAPSLIVAADRAVAPSRVWTKDTPCPSPCVSVERWTADEALSQLKSVAGEPDETLAAFVALGRESVVDPTAARLPVRELGGAAYLSVRDENLVLLVGDGAAPQSAAKLSATATEALWIDDKWHELAQARRPIAASDVKAVSAGANTVRSEESTRRVQLDVLFVLLGLLVLGGGTIWARRAKRLRPLREHL